MNGSDERAVYRILDVAANRAAEGLRTVEEFVRFALDDAAMVAEVKGMRHALTAALARVPREKRLAARDTIGDVGTGVSLPSERERQRTADVATAALARLQQSLRCLEEYGKAVSPEMAAEVERIRYRSYTLEKQLELTVDRRSWLAEARLYVLVDVAGDAETWRQRIAQLVAGGVDAIQVREKGANDRLLWERCRIAVETVRQTDAPRRCRLIVNDRADIAAAVDADGVHVGQEELPVGVVRRIVGENQCIGVSTHTIDQARQAVREGADYIGCGPTFPSRTKKFETFAGLEFLKAVAAEIDVPAFAIGGIDAENLPAVIATGVRRVAVAGAVWNRPDVAAAARGLRSLLDAAE